MEPLVAGPIGKRGVLWILQVCGPRAEALGPIELAEATTCLVKAVTAAVGLAR
jgi:hypothetical protein